ncbi:hypothetical protein DV735_g2854, partial [Chaetothyriales sp. CBS 134920]
MSANGSAVPSEQTSEIVDKGKGKAVEQPSHDLDMEDDDEEEESGTRSNIISNYGQRSTRNKEINWAEAAEKSKAADADNDHEMKD